MKCSHCHRNIASGVEATKMIIEYVQPDDSTKVFGYQMPDGPLTRATGRMLNAWHHKCFHIIRKREQRGDAGRVLSGIPTGDDMTSSATVEHVTRRLEQQRDVARRVGKAAGDPEVIEALRADEHGGPYPHTHHIRLDAYQLAAHLRYAHDCIHERATHQLVMFGDHRIQLSGSFDSQGFHDELHARMVLDATRAARHADPGHIDPPERDWREQTVADI